MYNDPVGNLAVAMADRHTEKKKSIKRDGNYREGIKICRDTGCTRLVEGKCYGWDDPLFMWEHYKICPHFSEDRHLIKKIDQACKAYEKGREMIGKKAEADN